MELIKDRSNAVDFSWSGKPLRRVRRCLLPFSNFLRDCVGRIPQVKAVDAQVGIAQQEDTGVRRSRAVYTDAANCFIFHSGEVFNERPKTTGIAINPRCLRLAEEIPRAEVSARLSSRHLEGERKHF